MEKYYLVDELDNDGMCFTSIQEIKEQAEWLGLKFEDLTIYETEMMQLRMDAIICVEHAIENELYFNEFNINNVSNKDLNELQDLLNKWCEKIDTNTYLRSKKLSVEERIKELEDEKTI